MRTVQHGQRLSRHRFETALPVDLSKPLSDGRFSDGPLPVPRCFDQRDGTGAIVELMGAQQGTAQLSKADISIPIGKARRGLSLDMKVTAQTEQRRMPCLRD